MKESGRRVALQRHADYSIKAIYMEILLFLLIFVKQIVAAIQYNYR